jgi:hypothetical protein
VLSYVGSDVDVGVVSEKMTSADRVNERWKTLAPNSHVTTVSNTKHILCVGDTEFSHSFSQLNSNKSRHFRTHSYGYVTSLPAPVAARSMASVYGRSPTAIEGSNPTGGMDVCLLCVLSGTGLCDGLITRPEESYRLWRVVVSDQETS